MSDHAPAQARRRGTRCPSCGARVTSAATWCSLCFTDLTPAASADGAAGATGGADAAGGADVERVAEQLLAELSVAAATTRRPPLALVATTGGRVAAMLLGTVLVTGLGFGLLTLGGALL